MKTLPMTTRIKPRLYYILIYHLEAHPTYLPLTQAVFQITYLSQS
jgi:hypothetical protein